MSEQTNIDDGGPAFPRSSGPAQEGVNTQAHLGMTLRDWFAGRETLADLADDGRDVSRDLTDALAGPPPDAGFEDDPVGWTVWDATWRAKLKYIRADAMLKARNAKQFSA